MKYPLRYEVDDGYSAVFISDPAHLMDSLEENAFDNCHWLNLTDANGKEVTLREVIEELAMNHLGF